MRDIGEGDPRDMPQLGRERMDVKIPGHPLVAIPLNVVRIGVDDEALADAARSIDVQHDLDVEIGPPEDVEPDASPAGVKQFLEIVRTREPRTDSCINRKCVSFSKWHIRGSLSV